MTSSQPNILKRIWQTAYQVGEAFIADEALTRGAAIAFYATTALVPVLYIIVSIAGGLYGEAAARGALRSDLQGLIGPESAKLLQAAIKNAAYTSESLLVSVVSIVMLIVVASGVFGEMRVALNIVWPTPPRPMTWFNLLRERLESLALVAVLAVLLLASMMVTTMIAVAGETTGIILPLSPTILAVTNFFVTWAVTAILFAALYRILPEKDLAWDDVAVGGATTALLFQLGQFAVGFYFGSSRVVSIYGAAGSLMALLLWIYYSAEIFLLGAELTKAYMKHRGRI